MLASRALKGKEEDFLVALGGINTANIVFTFMALHAIGKTRSGAAWAVSEMFGRIALGEVVFMMLVALLSCFLASLLTLRIGRTCLGLLEMINYRKMNGAVLITLLSLVLLFSGLTGLLIAGSCAMLGLACTRLGVKRMYLMGFLMLPTMLFYINLA